MASIARKVATGTSRHFMREPDLHDADTVDGFSWLWIVVHTTNTFKTCRPPESTTNKQEVYVMLTKRLFKIIAVVCCKQGRFSRLSFCWPILPSDGMIRSTGSQHSIAYQYLLGIQLLRSQGAHFGRVVEGMVAIRLRRECFFLATASLHTARALGSLRNRHRGQSERMR